MVFRAQVSWVVTVAQLVLVIMSGSNACEEFGFYRSSLPSALFGCFDQAAADRARRVRFLLRRRDPEYLEVLKVHVSDSGPSAVGDVAAVAAVAAPAGSEGEVRRSRRVRGLDAEFSEILRASCRRRVS